MAFLKCGEPIRLVFLGVLIRTDTYVISVNQSDYDGYDLVPIHLVGPKIRIDTPSELIQCNRELIYVLVLQDRFVFVPLGVVAILETAIAILARSLDVAILTRAEPYLGPSRRNRKGVEEIYPLFIHHLLPIWEVVVPRDDGVAPFLFWWRLNFLSGNAFLFPFAKDQTCFLCRCLGVFSLHIP